MESKKESVSPSIGLLILRVGMSAYLLTHGWGKLQMLLAGNLDNFADPIGLGSGVSLVLMVLAEVVCAILILIGLGTRFAAVPVVVAMAVAAFVVHGGDPWRMQEAARLFKTGAADSWSSKEPALLYLIPFLALIFTGAGRLSLDALIRRRRRRDEGARDAG